MSSMNWYAEVFGAHILEYQCKSRRNILTGAQELVSASGFMDPSGYFQYAKIITHPYNISDYFLAMDVKEYWQDYFFKGQDLNIGDVLIMPYTHTHKNHMTLFISFTYNKEINIRKISII